MISVAILGCDSTHTELFGSILQSAGAIAGVNVRLISLWGEDESQALEKAKKLGLKRNSASIEEALECANFAMVLGRFAESHLLPAKVALKNGIPVFVDKPFTNDFASANELIEIALETGVFLTSSSSMRFAKELACIPKVNEKERFFYMVNGPANCIDMGRDARFDSVFFYGIHAVEIMLQIANSEILDFSISRTLDSVTANIEFSNGCGVVNLIKDVEEFYELGWFKRSGHGHAVIEFDKTYNEALLINLFRSLKSGIPLVSHESTLQAMRILDAMEMAFRRGGKAEELL